MLRPGSLETRSRLGYAGEPVPCVQCDRREVGLAWGEYCTVCRQRRERRAARIAQRVAIGGALLLAAWLIWRTPDAFLPRLFGAASVLLLYVILRRIVGRVVVEYLPNETGGRADDGTAGTKDDTTDGSE
jgi:hypothetical protein